jgi:hypothetical protein
VVEDWKAKNLYPYEGEAGTQIERAERQIFDIVAVTVQEANADFSEIPRPQMALHLRMLRHAIERSPTELQRILDEVLRLPKRKQKELAVLLDETDLSAIISAATMVADRLKFLQGLRIILFDHEAKGRLKERSQLHKILETNTWIFGEEFNLWASDRELTTVLKIHKEKLDPDLIIDEPVKLLTRKRGIVDLMLSRAQKRHRADDYEHLVVELKAPKVKLTAKELTQIKDYALSVARDPRYHRVNGVRWHFWLVSDEYDDFVQAEIASGPEVSCERWVENPYYQLFCGEEFFRHKLTFDRFADALAPEDGRGEARSAHSGKPFRCHADGRGEAVLFFQDDRRDPPPISWTPVWRLGVLPHQG